MHPASDSLWIAVCRPRRNRRHSSRDRLAAVPWTHSQRHVCRTAARRCLGRRRSEGRLAQAGRTGIRRSRRRRQSRHPVPSRRQRGSPRVARLRRPAIRPGDTPTPPRYRDDFGFDEGPRAVPVVADGVIYTFGAEGQLHAVDLAKGTRLWSEDTMKRFGVPKASSAPADHRSSKAVASSPTSAATRPASWRSRRRPARCCGRRPMTMRAIRRE